MVDSAARRLRFVSTVFAGRLTAPAPLGDPDYSRHARVHCGLCAASATALSGISRESFTFSHDKRRPPLSGRHAATRTGETDEPHPMASARRADLASNRRRGNHRRSPCWLAHHATRLALRSEEHTSELQSRENLVCRLL